MREPPAPSHWLQRFSPLYPSLSSLSSLSSFAASSRLGLTLATDSLYLLPCCTVQLLQHEATQSQPAAAAANAAATEVHAAAAAAAACMHLTRPQEQLLCFLSFSFE